MDYVAFPTDPSAPDYDRQLAKWHQYQDFLKNPSTPDNELDLPQGSEGGNQDDDDQDDRSEAEGEAQDRPFVYSAEYAEPDTGRKRIFKERWHVATKEEAIEEGRRGFVATTGLGIDDIVKEKCNRSRGRAYPKGNDPQGNRKQDQPDEQEQDQEQGSEDPQGSGGGGGGGEGEDGDEGPESDDDESEEEESESEGEGDGKSDDDTPQMPTCPECGEARGTTPGCCQPEEQEDLPAPEDDRENVELDDLIILREAQAQLSGVAARERIVHEAHPEVIRVVTKALAGVDDWTRKLVANAVTEALTQVYGDLAKVAETCKKRAAEGGGGSGVSPLAVLKLVDKALSKILPEHLAENHEAIVAEITEKMGGILELDIEAIAVQVLEHISVPQRIVVETGGQDVEVEGTPHKMFARILTMLARKRNVMMVGPAGTGKGYLATMIAQALGMEDRYAYLSCSEGMSEGMLTGRCIPLANKVLYMGTEIVDKWEHGGLIFIDEVDASNPNVLLVLNEALSSGRMALPNRHENPYAIRHKDTHVLCAANTWGLGANLQYVGRNRLDAAFLDRFSYFEVDYDHNVERSIAEAYLDAKAARKVLKEWWRIRNKLQDLGMQRVWSTRGLEFACMDLAAGDPWDQVLAEKTISWTPDEKSRVGIAIDLDGQEVPF